MDDIYSVSSSRTYVLHLDDITYKDIINSRELTGDMGGDIHNNDDDSFGKYIDEIVFDKIPRYFSSYNSWIKSTNISCFFCTLSIDGIPVPVATGVEYNNDGRNVRYTVKHLCCSFNCAYAHIDSEYKGDVNKHKYISILKEIYQKIYNKKIVVIQPSPDKSRLQHHGGDLTPKEYRTCIKSLSEIDLHTGSTIERIM